jgi:hypothetical protein
MNRGEMKQWIMRNLIRLYKGQQVAAKMPKISPPQEPETLTMSQVFRRMNRWREEASRADSLGMHPSIVNSYLRASRHYANLLEEMKILNLETIVD